MKNLLENLLHKLRLLPLLVVVATLAFIVRIGDAAIQMRDLSGSAYAESKSTEAKPDDKAAEEKAAEAKPQDKPADTAAKEPDKDQLKDKDAAEKSAEKTDDKAGDKPGAVDLPSAAPPAWSDASDTDIDYSELRKELYQDLLQRRQQLDEKEKALGQREALLQAAEKELGKKYQELTGLRNEIQDLLKKQSEEETARIASLVKIYEGMKPKDAARIFNTLDMDILLDVVGKMSERKSSLIIAQMEAEKARNLTMMLAEQKKLPELPDAGQALPSN